MEKLITISETHYLEIVQKLNALIKMQGNGDGQLGDWISEKEAKRLLGKGTTTLWEMRRKGYITYSKINGTVYYSKKSILDLLKKNQVDSYR